MENPVVSEVNERFRQQFITMDEIWVDHFQLDGRRIRIVKHSNVSQIQRVCCRWKCY